MITYRAVCKGGWGWIYYEIYKDGILITTCDVGELEQVLKEVRANDSSI